MNDAGGVPGVMKGLGDRINRNTLPFREKTTGEIVDAAAIQDADIIRSHDNPVEAEGSLFIVKGSLARAARCQASGVTRQCGTLAHAESRGRGSRDRRAACSSVKPGTCVVIRMKAQRWSRNARDARRHFRADGPPASAKPARCTDGRFSGATHGPAIAT